MLGDQSPLVPTVVAPMHWLDLTTCVTEFVVSDIIVIHAADLPDSNLAAYVNRQAGPPTANVGLELGY